VASGAGLVGLECVVATAEALAVGRVERARARVAALLDVVGEHAGLGALSRAIRTCRLLAR
jgi:hypothetical protein